MVQTRRQGARPEGQSYSETQKRERRSAVAPRRRAPPARRDAAVSVPMVPPKYKDAATQTDFYVDASTQTDVELTSYPDTVGEKRRREEEEEEEENTPDRSLPKRPRKAETPKFLFSASRNRSLLTSAPAKTTLRHESPFFDRPIEPTGRQSTPRRAPRPRERAHEPQTPTSTPTPVAQGGLFGSVKKILGFFTATQGAASNEQKQGSSSEETGGNNDQEAVEAHSPTSSSPQPNGPDSPTPNPEPADSNIYNREHFKRRRFAKTIAGHETMADGDGPEAGEADFNPVETTGSNKRKMASAGGEIPGPVNGGFGIDDHYLDADSEVDGIDEAQPSTPRDKPIPQTPLRSAMRQNGSLFGTFGRSAKSVRIDPTASVKHVYGQYGYSGEYHGSMFSDPSDATDSAISEADVRYMHSPATLRNTRDNESPKFRLDQDIVDPNDESWRPSLANPSPGHFRVPDLDEYDEEEEDEGEREENIYESAYEYERERQHSHEPDQVPPQPGTPRMSHAELPSQLSSLTGHTDSMLMNESAEIRLNKARSEAQKYKPARSSLLSLSEHARSRSSSPPESEGDFTQSQLEVSTPGAGLFMKGQAQSTGQDKSAKPSGREELDKTIVGEDGMTDYQREHQYDEWAGNLAWPEPQTYEEAGIATDYIADLVRKTWTERDLRESVEFWDREFEEGLQAAREAAEQGRELVWVTDPEELFA